MRKFYALALFLFVLISKAYPQISAPFKLNISKPAGLGMLDNETKARFSWLPAKNGTEAADIWSGGERWKFLSMASLTGTLSGGSSTLDLVSDYLGPVRIALIGNVSTSKSDSLKDQKIERFLSGGGNAALVGNLIGPTLTWGKSGYLMLLLVPKLGLDLPALGSKTNTNTVNGDIGFEGKFNISGEKNQLGLFASCRSAVVLGESEFMNQLGLNGKKNFSYTLLNVGLTFPERKIAFLYTNVLNGPDGFKSYNDSGRISILITP